MPSRKTAHYCPPQTSGLFDQNVQGNISRREFLAGAARFAVAGISALAMLEALSPDYALGQQVAPDHKGIHASFVEFVSPLVNGTVRACLVKPAVSDRPLPLVLVVHENRALNPHIEDVARWPVLSRWRQTRCSASALIRAMKIGRAFYSPNSLLPKPGRILCKACVICSSYQAATTRSVWSVFVIAAASPTIWQPDLAAAVPFYGHQAELSQISAIHAPLLIHYASNDERVTAGANAYDEALKAAGKQAQSFASPNTQHGFHNAPRYDEAAAQLAWQHTLEFLRQHLR